MDRFMERLLLYTEVEHNPTLTPEERFTYYSDELAKREAGDMMGLDTKDQKHRIASLKRKIARAEVSLKKLQENS